MRYAREVEELLAAHPGKPFKMVRIRNYVEASLRIEQTDRQRREAVRQGIVRVLDALIECKVVKKTRPPGQKISHYVWHR